jgi:hypothetical protein
LGDAELGQADGTVRDVGDCFELGLVGITDGAQGREPSVEDAAELEACDGGGAAGAVGMATDNDVLDLDVADGVLYD